MEGLATVSLSSEREPDPVLDAGMVHRVNGVGLGLYASREIVLAHHGTITGTISARSPGLGAGGRFRVWIPGPEDDLSE